MATCRQGLRRRSATPLLRSISNATRHPAALDEAQAQAWLTQTVRPAQIPTAQHHRTHVWLAEREPPDRHALRQARKKLRRDGLAGLCHAVYATAFFRQSLARIENENSQPAGWDTGVTSLVPPGAFKHGAILLLSWTATFMKILGFAIVALAKQMRR